MDELLSDAREFLAIDSVSGSAAEQAAQKWVADKMRSWGWQVEQWHDDPADFTDHPDFPGMEVPRADVLTVVGMPPGSTGGSLILGHSDVVPGGPGPNVDEQRIAGRGSVDMKCGLLAGMHAAHAVGGDVAVCAVSGEEDGGIGTFLALSHGLRASRCVIPEPTGLAVVPANAGSLTFEITLPGVSAHGARRWDGHNALEAVPEVMARLHALEQRRCADVPELMRSWPIAYPISIGRIEGGDWASTVMGEVRLQGRYGVMLGESIPEAMAACEEVLVGTGAQVDWFGGRFASAALDSDHDLVRSLSAAHESVTGQAPEVFGGTYGSDLRQLVAAGIPTVQYGPGDAALAHSDDEEVPTDEVVRCMQVLENWLRAI